MTFSPQLLEPLQTPKALPGCLCLAQLILSLQHKALLANSTLCDAPTPFCRAAGAPSAPALLHISPSTPLALLSRHSGSSWSLPPPVPLSCTANTQHTHRGFTAVLTPQLQHPNQTKANPNPSAHSGLAHSQLCVSHSQC